MLTATESEPGTRRDPRVFERPVSMPGSIVQGKPGSLLRDRVLGYLGFPPKTPLPPVRRFIPMGTVLLMLEFGPAPGQMVTGGRRLRLPVQPAVGLHDHAVMLEPQPAHGITIMLTPPGAHALFGVALRELANTFTGAGDLLGNKVALLVERLVDIPDWPARFALLDRTLAAWLASGPQPAAAITRAWRRLYESGGRLRITDLAAEIGTSRRYLEKRFDEQVGLTPKTLARIVRLQGTANLITATACRDLASVAGACGYSDHAHLDREFKDILGCTPTEFLADLGPGRAGHGYGDRGKPREARAATSNGWRGPWIRVPGDEVIGRA